MHEEAQVQEAFGTEVKDSVRRFGEKRKKRFTEDGIRIVPFNMKEEFRSHEVDEYGNLNRGSGRREEQEDDAWLDSVKDTLEDLEKKEAL